ncbi:MAG: apolipoprotein N-acyltransferase, partial [Porticoccaceae bacterium]
MGTKSMALYIGLLFAGAILPLALAPFSYWPIAIISMAILFSNIYEQSTINAFKRSLIFGLGMFGTGVSWVFVSMYVFGDISALLALIGTFLFCLFNAIFFALPFMLCSLISKRRFLALAVLPALWVISEWIRSWLFTGFPWLYAGYSHTDTWLSGWAPVGGVLLLSFFTALAAAALVQIRLYKHLASTLATLSLVTAMFLGGLALQKIDWTEPVKTPVSVA